MLGPISSWTEVSVDAVALIRAHRDQLTPAFAFPLIATAHSITTCKLFYCRGLTYSEKVCAIVSTGGVTPCKYLEIMFLFLRLSGEVVIMVTKIKLSSWVCKKTINVPQAKQCYSDNSKEVTLYTSNTRDPCQYKTMCMAVFYHAGTICLLE